MLMIGESGLRQVVIGGEPVRSIAVDKWIGTAGAGNISLVSTYGPTEATVVVTYCRSSRAGRWSSTMRAVDWDDRSFRTRW